MQLYLMSVLHNRGMAVLFMVYLPPTFYVVGYNPSSLLSPFE